MKFYKQIIIGLFTCVLALSEVISASAKESTISNNTAFCTLDSTKTNDTDNYSLDENVLNNLLSEGFVETSRTTNITHEDDLVITEKEIIFKQLFSSNLIGQYSITKAANYKSEFAFNIYEVSSSKGKKLLRLDQTTEFKRNGSFAYVVDHEYIYYLYNGSVFVNRKSGYTSASNKSTKAANYWISGDIKWSTKNNSYTKHRVFTAKCTPNGTISHTITQS